MSPFSECVKRLTDKTNELRDEKNANKPPEPFRDALKKKKMLWVTKYVKDYSTE